MGCDAVLHDARFWRWLRLLCERNTQNRKQYRPQKGDIADQYPAAHIVLKVEFRIRLRVLRMNPAFVASYKINIA